MIGIFIELSKIFDTIDYSILIKKNLKHGVKGNNLRWFESYLNRTQYIRYNSNKCTTLESIIYGCPTRI